VASQENIIIEIRRSTFGEPAIIAPWYNASPCSGIYFTLIYPPPYPDRSCGLRETGLIGSMANPGCGGCSVADDHLISRSSEI